MAEGMLTYESFWKLSKEKRCEQYSELSERDRFRVRLSMNPGVKLALCNTCAHYRGYAKCDAFPDGIPSERLMQNEQVSLVQCKNGIGFQDNVEQ